MKITVKYDERWYGNEFEDRSYDLTITDSKSCESAMEIDIKFDSAAFGRGANWENKGMVKGANLRLSKEHARKIAAAILWHLETSPEHEDQTITLGF